MHCSETLLEHTSTVVSQSMVWHQRLGHIHHHGLQQILQHGAVVRLPKMIVTNTPCEICALGKQTRQKVPKTRSTDTTGILQLIHADVCGPFQTTLLGGARYFLTFIDDFSKMTFVCFLATESEVFDKFV